MSADYYISCARCDETHNGNITYNLTPMLREAGYPPHKAMTGAPCSEAGGVFAKTAATLLADPDRFKALNPENGWGDYDGAVEWLQRMSEWCAHAPSETIGTWL